MKRRILSLCMVAVTALSITACSGNAPAKTETKDAKAPAAQTETADVKAPEKDVQMQYIKPEDMKKNLDSADYTIIDVRKEADYKTSHLPKSKSADMDAAKNGDFKAGVETMKKATEGVSNNIVLVCYSGKSYAQAATNTLSALGYDMQKVYTLEGGMKAWTAAYPDALEK